MRTRKRLPRLGKTKRTVETTRHGVTMDGVWHQYKGRWYYQIVVMDKRTAAAIFYLTRHRANWMAKHMQEPDID